MPTPLTRRHALRLAFAATAAAVPLAATQLGAGGPAAAQGTAAAWPARPLRLLVAYAPGGGTDAIARALAARLQAELGQPVVVENKPGAGGNLATEAAATAKPDGYTLLMGNQGPMSVNPTLFPRFRVNPETALDPVALVADAPLVVVAGPGTRRRTCASWSRRCASARATSPTPRPRTARPATSPSALLCQMAGVEAVHVPYRGAGPALTEVVAGNVAFMATTLPSVTGLLQGGQLRAIAVTGDKRVDTLPDVPTVAEAAGLPDYRATAWYGILVPKGTPAPIRGRLAEAIQKSLAAPELAVRLREEGAEPAHMEGEAFGRLIREERVRWAEVIRAARITAD
jgi:tripartite-type tricarboxylate transporter receptor subunit TctC